MLEQYRDLVESWEANQLNATGIYQELNRFCEGMKLGGTDEFEGKKGQKKHCAFFPQSDYIIKWKNTGKDVDQEIPLLHKLEDYVVPVVDSGYYKGNSFDVAWMIQEKWRPLNTFNEKERRELFQENFNITTYKWLRDLPRAIRKESIGQNNTIPFHDINDISTSLLNYLCFDKHYHKFNFKEAFLPRNLGKHPESNEVRPFDF